MPQEIFLNCFYTAKAEKIVKYNAIGFNRDHGISSKSDSYTMARQLSRLDILCVYRIYTIYYTENKGGSLYQWYNIVMHISEKVTLKLR